MADRMGVPLVVGAGRARTARSPLEGVGVG